MASELDDKEGDRKKVRVTPAAATDGDRPARKGEVTPEVARVVNLLQRLDKLHSKPPANEPPPVPRGDHAGLSSLSERPRERAGLRAVPSAPIAFTPPPLPPVSTRDDLPSVLKGPLPVGNDATKTGPAVSAQQAAAPGAAPFAAAKLDRPQTREKRDKPPVVLIGSVIIGLVAFGGLGLYQFQRGAPVARRDQALPETSTGGGQARADAAASLVPAKTADAAGASCAASLTGTDQGVVMLAMTDTSRAGKMTTIAVDDLNYRTAFDANGVLRFEAPLLAQQAVVRWDRANGPSCEKPVVMPKAAGMLRVALVWSGEVALDLHVIEPNAWFGGPSGHISSLNRNTDQSHGAGLIRAFGDGKGAAKALVYTVEAARIAPGGVLNAFVKPAANAAKESAACADKAATGEERQVQYQVLILRTAAQSGEVQTETKSFAIAISPCGADGGGGRGERIIVKNG